MFKTLNRPEYLLVTLCAAAILMITMGIRQSFGLFVAPIDDSTGMGIVTISFALAVGQFTWGAAQPVAGILADRYGPAPVLYGSMVLMALGLAATTLVESGFWLMVTLGIVACVGSGGGSFSVLIGATAQRMTAEARGTASGIINAGGSFGQFIFAPIIQRLIQTTGWVGTMLVMAAAVVAALPLVRKLTGVKVIEQHHEQPDSGIRAAISQAMKDRSYLLLHAGFFTCGFHIAFLVTHLPGEINLCGLPPSVAGWALSIIGVSNIIGSLVAGALVAKYRSKYVLFFMYGSRAVLIAIYLMMPQTAMTYYLFAAGLGFTWLATVPPTATLVGKLFGSRYLGTLFGLTLLSHQIGGFLGAWLGGLSMSRFGDYTWMWYADMALAAAAALVNLPIREAPMAPRETALETP